MAVCDARFPDIDRQLAVADDALKRGDPAVGRTHAVLAGQMAVQLGDLRQEAEALLRVARADATVSRLRDAHQAAHRAAHLFDAVGDLRGEIRALTGFSNAASCLRHNDSALSAALLATRLAAAFPPERMRTAALDALGVALMANGDFAAADEALLEGAAIAAQAGDRSAEFHPRLNRCYAHIVRAIIEQHLYGHPPDAHPLSEALADCQRLEQAGGVRQLASDADPTSRALMCFAECFAASWRGDVPRAEARAADVAAWASRHARTTWLRALAMWAQCEVAWRSGALSRAENAVRCMIDTAIAVEHEQIARTGYMLASQILDAQGRSREALAELRTLAQRDIEIRREGLEHHERVAGWQIELRTRSQQVRELEETSRKLERLSMEDPLTGLPNRRQLEQVLAETLEQLSRGGETFTVALIDVDRFKEINDGYSHIVGDLVLKTFAGLLKSHVRQADLPARLAGDEFVVVFRHADMRVARNVCERLQMAVAHHPWRAVGGPDAVAISVGLAQAAPCDTIETLLGRGDEDMYRAKMRLPG